MTKLTESDDLPSALLEEIQLYNVALKQEDGEQLSEDDISALYQVRLPLYLYYVLFMYHIFPVSYLSCTISLPGCCPPSPHLSAYQGAHQGASAEEVSEVQDHEDGHDRGRP